ncbi:isoleucine--tRNA ligase, mitochondrial [Microplitis demolitor]|uniref:isoleucine--tRNA ligase, mitochondrial n=1 Tax=Microplitis demolitor TaxID=69319 RepID=UPI0004CD228C|nr:isoleucine--tRNA ligase, mitochondrial [Microplitis demolitor]
MAAIIKASTCNLIFKRYINLSFKFNAKPEKAVENKYSNTVLLPQTKFPSRLNGAKRIEMDNYLIEKCGFNELYNWQRDNLAGPDFILHDGPPYANGTVHMGHAVNKILKDITTRSRVIKGQRVHYVPGWDCHGLPIELKALSALKDKKDKLTPLEIRQHARKYAEEAIKHQRESFISWGIMADWKDNCYFTNNISFMTNQLRQFINLYEKKFIFRAFKPVHWSPSSRTALAESELEYNEQHSSKCATVRFLVTELSDKLKVLEDRAVYALTWTTTPWTLIANQALAYAEDISYCIAEDPQGNCYIIAEDLLNTVIQKIGALRPILTALGSDLAGLKYSHPITGESMPFYPASHVTSKVGTGLVHTAPAHGSDDFIVSINNNIPVLSLVDEDGRYTAEAGTFAGLDVLKEGGDAILQHIGDNVMHTEDLIHSYPYDWRTKKPVITRASYQWFINTEPIKHKAVEALESVKMFPRPREKSYLNNLKQHVLQRPFWCISRQRAWGTPIPVFYNKETGQVIVDKDIIERLCKLLEREGPDCWWTLPVEKLIGHKLLDKLNIDADKLERGNDIMDIWLDSGLTWSTVLPEGQQADLYVEGMDQFNGWFQSSLLTSMAVRGISPFKSIFVHGFTVDRNGMKMSKSLGNVFSPEDIIRGGKNLKTQPAYGVDTLRWWVASHGVQHTQIPMVNTLLQNSVDSVQKIRLILKFLLGALHPYDAPNDIKPNYLLTDKYMLHRLYHYHKEIRNYYDNYEYHNVCKAVLHFVANDISAFYCHLTKDRLYCEEVTSPLRVAATSVIGEILIVLTRSIAPIIPHLAEEVWLYHPDNLTSVPLYHSTHTLPNDWDMPKIEKIMNVALEVKSILNRETKSNTLELETTVTADAKIISTLSPLQPESTSSSSELCNILQVNRVTFIEDPACETPKVYFKSIDKSLCKRCRKYSESAPGQPCIRCIQILNMYSRS